MSKRSPLVILQAVKFQIDGNSPASIAALMNISVATVNTYLASPEAEQIRKEVKLRSLDTMADVQTDFQAGAPLARQVLEAIMLDPNNKAETRARAAAKYLEFAGHRPIERVHLIDRKSEIEQEFGDKTEEEIRNKIIADLDDGSQKRLPSFPTVH